MRALQIGFGAFLAFLCAVFLLKATFNHFYRLRRSEALLLEKSRDMEALNARFALLLSNIPQGVAWFGRDRRSSSPTSGTAKFTISRRGT